jgi:putative SOS response-associated peptidase YedK
MCGRKYDPDTAAMEREWHIGRHNSGNWIKRYNVAPTMQVPIIVKASDEILELNSARWGLIPEWWKKKTPPSFTFNARSEEAADLPTWRDSLRTMRCLMPVCGWYEWNEEEKVLNASGRVVNQPYFIHSPQSEVIAFAGLWAVWKHSDMQSVLSCALLSKVAAPGITHINHRMPIVLKPEQYDAWLSTQTTANEVQDMIANPREDFSYYRVNTRVNNARNDGKDLIEEID